ncbi:hypothetical protein LGH83_19170 [Lichenihabitans sp. PAMC28606]|uniref:type III effector HrpK domain-containing protein n=1 Tax=Lichenihabitans sp. PAMC28606 TaxID=2880932 RepID=UPI001D0B7392|nr:type III effector HrpK domain-containing protein [Lichenihabitans sp. PAMC28606]UDL94588.1 hypothetical protein LGH83_19170 [Lichenihabitans sp. PAMC28606]
MTTITSDATSRGRPNGGSGSQVDLPRLFEAALSDRANIRIGLVEPMPLPRPKLPAPAAPQAGSPLDQAEQLSANWDTWGLHQGVDFANPPSTLPQNAQDTLKFFAANPTLFSAIVQDAGGKPGDVMTKSALDTFISDAKSDAATALKAMPAGTPTTETLTNVNALLTNWHAWGLHSVTQMNNPPADLPADAKATLSFITSNPSLMSQLGNGTGTGVITEADVASYLTQASADASSGAPPEFGPTDSIDTLLDGSKYSTADQLKLWDGLTTGMDPTTAAQTEKELNRPLAAAQLLSDNWNRWGLHTDHIDFANPPDSVPPEGREILQYIAQNPALETALDVGNSGGSKADGIIQHDDVDRFIADAKGSATNASNAYADYVKKNPDAGDLSKSMVRSAAIVSANQQIIQNADPSHPNGTTDETRNDGLVTSAGLAALSASNPGLSASLGSAAKLWSQPGMFNQFDMSGDDPAINQADGTFDAGNIQNWISKSAPTNDQQFTAILSDAANRTMVAGVDTSSLGPDVFANPSHYTGAQKAAVLQKLTDLDSKITLGNKEDYWDEPLMENKGINPNIDKVQTDLGERIAQLSADPDVQKFISDNQTTSLQTIVDSDPDLKGTMQTFYDGNLQNGQGLTDALAAKGSDGKPLSTENGLQAFIGEAGVFSKALGTDGKATTGLDLQQIAQKSGQQDKLQQAYETDILSGKELSDSIASGTDIGTAVRQYTSDAAAFGSTLPTQYVADNAAKLQQTFSDTLTTSLFGSTTQTELNTAFADASGNLDTAKLNDVMTQVVAQNPDAFKDSAGNAIPPDKIVSAFGSVFNEVRQGAKLQDALAKLSDTKATGPLADAYNKGLLHGVSALFSAGALAAKGVEGGSSPTVPAALIAGSFQVMGGLMEAGSKYAKSTGALPNILDSDALKVIEGAGKAIGGAGGIIAGALGIFSGVQSLKNGDQVGGGIGIAGGITGTWSGVLGLLEGGIALGDTFGIAIGADAAALAATSATLGIIGAGVGILGLLGLGIYALVEQSKHTFAFTDQTAADLNQWGITGGPVQPGDTTPLPMVAPGTGQ